MSAHRSKKRKFVYIITSVIVGTVLLGTLGFGYTFIDIVVKDERPVANIDVDKDMIRMGTDVNFSAEGSTGKIRHYEWTMENETVGDTMDINITFKESDWYLVMLKVTDKRGRVDKAGVMVGVQRSDELSETVVANDRNLVPIIKFGHSQVIDVAPNIGYPIVVITAEVQNVIGTVGLEVKALNGTHEETVFDESRRAFGSSISFSFTMDAVTFFENSTQLESILWIENGKHGGFKLSIDAKYPFEDLVPPLTFEDIEAMCDSNVGYRTVFTCE